MKNILIIEDDRMLNKGVAFALKKDGYNTMCAYTKEEGKKLIQQNEVDFLLLDIGLPDGSGLDLCNEIKEKIDFPIVFFTANDTEEDMIKGFESGCDDYISKPFSIEVLKFKINAILKRSDIHSKKLWDYNGNYVDDNTLSVNIRRIRKKIEDDSKNPEYIITLFGIGYTLGE